MGGPCPPCLLQVSLVAAGSLLGGTAGGVFSLSKEQQLSDSYLPSTFEGMTPGWQGLWTHMVAPDELSDAIPRGRAASDTTKDQERCRGHLFLHPHFPDDTLEDQ